MHYDALFATDKTYYKRSTGPSCIFRFCLVCGKQRRLAEMLRPSSKDKLGRPALYFKPGRDGFNAEASGVKYLVYCLERVSLKHWCGSFSEMLWKLSVAHISFMCRAGNISSFLRLLAACHILKERSPDQETQKNTWWKRHMRFSLFLQAIACVDKKAKLGQLMVSPEDEI